MQFSFHAVRRFFGNELLHDMRFIAIDQELILKIEQGKYLLGRGEMLFEIKLSLPKVYHNASDSNRNVEILKNPQK